jgi:pimeloyl-ACP methyl ester carboxylesterase
MNLQAIVAVQHIQTFHGDLKFYFRRWDGRGRVEKIDTKVRPVYLLTGEYDCSCTPEASAETARKIPGARFEMMKGLGHFPMTEDPEASCRT